MCTQRIVLLLCVVIGSKGAVEKLPVTISPIEIVSCHSALMITEKSKAEIVGALRHQVNPYLTKQYEHTLCGGRDWTKLVAVNMSDDSNRCPINFTKFTSPIKSCGRNGDARKTSTTFSVGHSYSRICGRVEAIQKGYVNGFGPILYDPDPDHYVDGIVIHYGSSIPQGHIWTFVAAPSHSPKQQDNGCPCAYRKWNFISLPSFMGSNYFCESGNPSTVSYTNVFLDDPLWDGKGCASNSTCCQFKNPPWFHVNLPHSTTDGLTMTLFLNGGASEENIFITEIELYVSR